MAKIQKHSDSFQPETMQKWAFSVCFPVLFVIKSNLVKIKNLTVINFVWKDDQMINILSRKNLLALLLTLAVVGPQAAWGMDEPNSLETPVADVLLQLQEAASRNANTVQVPQEVINLWDTKYITLNDNFVKLPEEIASSSMLSDGKYLYSLPIGSIIKHFGRDYHGTSKGFYEIERGIRTDNGYTLIFCEGRVYPEYSYLKYTFEKQDEKIVEIKQESAKRLHIKANSIDEAIAQIDTSAIEAPAAQPEVVDPAATTAQPVPAAKSVKALALEIKQGRLATAEVGTAAGRMIAIAVNQHMKNKFGKDSKKALISDAFANLLRIANDVTMLSNERCHDRKYWLNLATLLCSAIDAGQITVNVKKLLNKEYSDKKKVDATAQDEQQKQITKLVNAINSYVPYLEGVLALIRSGVKTEKLGNHTNFAYFCTLFITLARAAEFYAAAEDSKNLKAVAYGVAAVNVLAMIVDFIPSKKVVEAAA